ncbi:hypothetical protein NM688_g5423 [Phlebia brevispora]|uniref:Uncharacterized protein n=1 Tax=Phlebia brevispora TaxID=194682 RepID=A0ACC1SVJ5_9APHY|nr:hypothetical protein NM688_g5423 [Phlebia brevispora]
MATVNVRAFVHRALPEALDIVRSVVSAHPAPLRTKELYSLALKQPVEGKVQHILRPELVDPKDTPLPPHAEHPIRSMSYLKRVVLPVLAKENFVKKVHSVRQMTTEEIAALKTTPSKSARKTAEQGVVHEWSWALKGPMPIQKPQPPKTIDPKEIAFGGDISHLSKRRQRSRQKTIARELEWVKELEQARREGVRVAQ